MIRKPSEADYRESATVTAVRETKKITIESGKGVGEGLRWIMLLWFGGVMLFGLFASIAMTAPWLLLLALPGGWYAWTRAQNRKRGRVERTRAAADCAAPPIVQAGVLRYDRGALAQSMVKRLVPALAAFWLSTLVLEGLMLALGLALFALSFLTGNRMAGDQVALSYDAESVTGNGLLGKGRLMWADVEDVSIRKFSIFNLPVLFTAGKRRNLVIDAPHSRLDGPTRLLVPIDWLGLDEDGQIALIASLIGCRAAGGVEVPSWQARPEPETNAERFDPDAIMARALAERAQVIETARPDLVGRMVPRHFGRKSA